MFLLCTLVALASLPSAHAAPPEYPVWLGGFADVGASTSPGVGGGFGALAGVMIGKGDNHNLALEGRVGEGLYASDVRTVGNIDFDVRYPGDSGPFVYLGFAHHHELSLDEALTHPVGAIAATYSGITHRTGFELGAGWDMATPFPKSSFGARIRPTVRVNAVVLPDGVSPSVYVVGNIGILLGVGRPRS